MSVRVVCHRCGGDTAEKNGMSVCVVCDFHMYWPPVGEHAETWAKFEALDLFDDQERHRLLDCLQRWRDENSTLVAYTENGEWMDVEADWEQPRKWFG